MLTCNPTIGQPAFGHLRGRRRRVGDTVGMHISDYGNRFVFLPIFLIVGSWGEGHPGRVGGDSPTTSFLAQVDPLRAARSFLERVADRPGAAFFELLMIGVVVYTTLRFLQGTRGARLVRAVLAILAVSFAVVWLVAEQFGLDRINVLYPYFILGVFLVSLVAFQTELRRLLLRLGEGGWLDRWFKTSSTHVIDPVVTAVERLSRKQVGALIAIERTTEVGAVSDAGVRLDAVVSSELIETIFLPGTALHDLGVIIRQGRIVAAGCQFPLAESGEVDRSLGSRHRAGLGMSHEADAVVIIVSEETGLISVAMQGRLRRGLSPKALRSLLTKQLVIASPSSGKPVSKEA